MTRTRKIIIDTDPGHDDMLAILLMCMAPEIEVCAVTTVAGNSTIQNVTNNAQFILKLAGSPGIPLFSGAKKPLKRKQALAVVHGESGLEGIEVAEQRRLDGRAVENILRLIRNNPGEISLLVLGPQTNIATAIMRDPETMKLAREFVIMGGAFKVPGNKNRVAEFNIAVDPEAAAIVANFPVKKTYIPLDVCNQIQVPLDEFARIKDVSICKNVCAAMESFVSNLRANELNVDGALMYDALAAYFLLKPELCKTEEIALVVETEGAFTYGMTLVDERPFSKKEPANASVVTSIPKSQFIEDYFAIVGVARR